jgi:hypothetical protein
MPADPEDVAVPVAKPNGAVTNRSCTIVVTMPMVDGRRASSFAKCRVETL